MKAVEVGAKEWHEAQMKLRARRDAMRAHAERTDPRNLLSRARTDNVDIEIDHGYDRDKKNFGIYASVASIISNPMRSMSIYDFKCIFYLFIPFSNNQNK